jgi:hypothetical protein
MEKREIKHEKKKEKKKKENKYTEKQSKLDEKITEQEKRLEDLEAKTNALENEAREKIKVGDRAGAKRILLKQEKIVEHMKQIEGAIAMIEEQKMMLDCTSQMKDVMSAIKCGNSAVKECSKGMSVEDLEYMKENMEDINPDQEELDAFFKDYDNENVDVDDKLDELERDCAGNNNAQTAPLSQTAPLLSCPVPDEEDDLSKFLAIDSEPIKIKEEKKIEKKTEKKVEDLKIDLKNKEDVMKIINCQDFVNGYWDINDKTKNVKNKYEKEFKLLKKLKNIDDILAMTIIIVYFINKEHKELLNELLLILKKAKLYIQDKAGNSYDNIIKQIGIK